MNPQSTESEVVESALVGPREWEWSLGKTRAAPKFVRIMYWLLRGSSGRKDSTAIKRLSVSSPDQLFPFREETSIHRGPGPHSRSIAAEPMLELGPDSGSFYNAAHPQLLRYRPEKTHTSGTTEPYPGPGVM